MHILRFAGRPALFFAALVLLFSLTSISSASTLRGTVRDAETGAVLTGANVVLQGTPRGAATDLDGAYVIFNVDPGRYTAIISMLGYESSTVSDLEVSAKGVTQRDFVLSASAVSLEEVTFTAGSEQGSEQRELEERLDKSSITDAISREALKKLPDPDVANVVRRATGVSVEKGDPIVRGLGVRYSKVTLNNASISGTEPNRSAVSLELFPASLMDQVTISKSFLPDQSGEFAGGVVNMSTLSLPKNLTVNASATAGYNSNSTFEEFYTYSGGDLDFLGIDDGTRALPAMVEASGEKLHASNFDLGDYIQLSRSFSNTWEAEEGRAMPNMGYSVAIGNQTTLAGRRLGFMISGLYNRNSTRTEAARNVFKGGSDHSLELMHDYRFTTYTRGIGLGSMASLRYSLSDLSTINANVVLSRDVSDEVRFFEGTNRDREADIRSTRLRWVAEQTVTGQLFGDHALPALASSINWQMTYSRGTRDEPDTRDTQFEDNGSGTFVLANETYSGSRIFNDLRDYTYSGGVDWTSRPLGDDYGFELKTGLSAMYKDRVSNYHRYEFEPGSMFSTAHGSPEEREAFLSQSPEALFAPENVGPSGFLITEYTRPTDSYTATQNLYAGYLMSELPITGRLTATGGVRYEYSDQTVESFEPFTGGSGETTEANLATGDFLPALSLRYTLQPRMNLRLAASQTVSRPDFRELSEFEYTDFVGGRAVIGNPDLERALIRNVDVRWEMVHGVADLLAASVFVKQFDNPIETVIQATAQHRLSYDNAESATNYGAEFEIRQNLSLISDELRTLTVSGNLSLIESSVEVGSGEGQIQTSTDRPLMGQSPYLLNLGLGYIHPTLGTQLNLFYNTFGERISEVGAANLPDVKEQPRHDLDLTARHPLSDVLALKLAAKNLLDTDYRFTQGGEITERYHRGRSISIGVSWTK